MEVQIEAILAKLKSEDLVAQVSGLDEVRVLIADLAHCAAEALFASPAESRLAIAEKLYALGPVVIPELEHRLDEEEEPEALTHASLILLKHGSTKGVSRLIQSLRDGVGPIGTLASSLVSARVSGTSEAITEVLTKGLIRKDPYTAVTLLSALRDLGAAIPKEALQELEESAPHLRRFF